MLEKVEKRLIADICAEDEKAHWLRYMTVIKARINDVLYAMGGLQREIINNPLHFYIDEGVLERLADILDQLTDTEEQIKENLLILGVDEDQIREVFDDGR